MFISNLLTVSLFCSIQWINQSISFCSPFRQVCVPAHDQCVPAAQYNRASCWDRVQWHHGPVRLSGGALPETRSLLPVAASPGVAPVLRHCGSVCGWLHCQTHQWKDVLCAAARTSLTRTSSSSHPLPIYTSDAPEARSASATSEACTANPTHTCASAAGPASVQ